MSGRYWDKCREKRPNRLADDEALQEKLMDVSAQITGA
jgi:hypothetical protein